MSRIEKKNSMMGIILRDVCACEGASERESERKRAHYIPLVIRYTRL